MRRSRGSVYVLDTSSIRVFGNYYPTRFAKLWKNLSRCIKSGRLISVSEVLTELDRQSTKPHLDKWAAENKRVFLRPTAGELEFVARIFAIPHFQQLVGEKQRRLGMPVADPFIIASAHEREACVVTEESRKAHAGKIPNVCDYFGIDCINLETFMEREGWFF